MNTNIISSIKDSMEVENIGYRKSLSHRRGWELNEHMQVHEFQVDVSCNRGDEYYRDYFMLVLYTTEKIAFISEYEMIGYELPGVFSAFDTPVEEVIFDSKNQSVVIRCIAPDYLQYDTPEAYRCWTEEYFLSDLLK